MGLAHDRHGDLAFVDTPAVELTDYRDRFPILASTTYLINHSLGAMPAEAERRLQQFAREWATRGARAWGEGWWNSVFTTGDLIGGIIGAPPGSTVMHQNVTVAEAIVLSCFDLKPPRNRIVFEEGLFPSVRYVQQAWARFGAEVVVCEDAERGDRRDRRAHAARPRLARALQVGGDPADRADRRARARVRRARLSRRVSVGRRGAARRHRARDRVLRRRLGEVAVRRAGRGLAVRAPRSRRRSSSRRSPAGRGTRGRSRSRRRWSLRPAPARFLTGTPNVAANYAASAGYEIIAEIGVDRIRENSMRQTALLVELVDAAGFELTSPREPEKRGGSVVFRVPDFQAVHAELAAREIICDTRPDAGIRFGPHFFTTDDELRFAVDQVQRDPRLGRAPRARARRGRLLDGREQAEREQRPRRCRRRPPTATASDPRASAESRGRSRGRVPGVIVPQLTRRLAALPVPVPASSRNSTPRSIRTMRNVWNASPPLTIARTSAITIAIATATAIRDDEAQQLARRPTRRGL